jgi:hypothetical protein
MMVMDTMVLTYSVLFIGHFVAEKEAEKRRKQQICDGSSFLFSYPLDSFYCLECFDFNLTSLSYFTISAVKHILWE